ncbi:copper ion binding protein [[Candida] boidinii]|nr:copper ion binding protein [[Candida] boidinii]OWB61035.1 copper ion binding protein [[Candida] boidinii]OWB72248.1 copper ion binding protein [[Candida] boidinii]OWB76915.1 copper ion binding protein [[Candida] boidinii]
MALHPFDPITDAEMRITSKLVKDQYKDGEKPHFVTIDRLDPPKKDMVKYLDAEKKGLTTPHINRTTFAYFYLGEVFYKALVNTTYKHVITIEKLPKGVVGPLLPEDVMEIEEYIMTHPIVAAEIAKLKLPKEWEVRTDPWIYGTDDPEEDRLLIQFYMYVANASHKESNHYSLPLKFSPVFNGITKEYVRMDYLPAGIDETVEPTKAWDQFRPVEYHPDLNGETELREIKPLIYEQPEGPSFGVDGTKITWQGWEFRVCSNVREGFAVYDVSFKGRSVIYRLALSEMTVPYGDPRAPYHRKQAFDLGDCGFGTNGNSLALGCDCLGVIKYFDTIRTNAEGEPVLLPNTICMHEQDYGILYKHVNYRTNHAVVSRRREFVVQTIATVANYEYIINLVFDQTGQINIQVRATGILSTMPIEDGVQVPWGTNIGPGVMAAYHQHMLSFRIDPAVDGHKNSVVFDDVVRLPKNTTLNPYNVGFITERTYVEKPGYVDQSPFTNRSCKIINENKINATSGKPVGYKVVMPARQMLMADPESYNNKRAKFATQQVWVTKYQDNELYAGGEFTNQSQDDTGLAKWAVRDDNVRNEDCVVWATLGFTHIPRPEDFPVMPVEIHQIELVPFGFFERNPALDLPQSTNGFNKSVYYKDSVDSASKGSSSCCKSSL